MIENIVQNLATGLLGKLFQPKGLTPAQRWALAAGGVLTKLNKDTFETLQNDFHKEEGIRVLKEWWGIHNTTEVQEMIASLTVNGHRRRFEPRYKEISILSEDQFKRLLEHTDPDNVPLYVFIWENRARFVNGTLLSWDLARLINICRFAYTAGYISEAYAWQKIMEAARSLQAAYPSWDALIDSYLLGYRFWQDGSPVREGEAVAAKWLKTSPESPCRQIPWKTKLG